MPGARIGYVYIMKSQHITGLKIGFTTKSIQEREVELNTTGVASPLKAIYYVLVENPFDVEQLAHRKLAQHRVSENREFFDCEEEKAKKYINDATIELKSKIYEIFSIKTTKDEINKNKYPVELNWPKTAWEIVHETIRSAENEVNRTILIYGALIKQYPKFDSDLPSLTNWLVNFMKLEDAGRPFELTYTSVTGKKIRAYCNSMPEDEFLEKWEELRKYIIENLFRPLESNETYKLAGNTMRFLKNEIKKYCIELKKNSAYKNLEKSINSIDKEIFDATNELLTIINRLPASGTALETEKWCQLRSEIKDLTNRHQKATEIIDYKINLIEKENQENGELHIEIEKFLIDVGFNKTSCDFILERIKSQIFPAEKGINDILSLLYDKTLEIHNLTKIINNKFSSYEFKK